MGESIQIRHFCTAWRTPCRPEINENDLTVEICDPGWETSIQRMQRQACHAMFDDRSDIALRVQQRAGDACYRNEEKQGRDCGDPSPNPLRPVANEIGDRGGG